MRRSLAPVIAKEAYAQALEPELVAWMDDVVFGPLFDELRSAGVKLEARDQAVSDDEYSARRIRREDRANAGAWTPFPPEFGSLGLPRSDMPQIPSTARGALVGFLAARGVTSREALVLPGVLKPTQGGYWPDKVAAAADHGGSRAILISSDGRILDGHHQWMAALAENPDEPIRAIRFSKPIARLLELARTFPSSERANAEGSEAIRAALAAGRLWSADGAFGSNRPFGAELVRELRSMGATFDPATRLYVLPPGEVPIEVKSAVDAAQAGTTAVYRAMIDTLSAAAQNVTMAPAGLNLERPISRIVADLEHQFGQSIAKGPAAVTVAPQLQPAVREALTRGLTKNLDLSIKNFAAEEIPLLRQMVEANLMAGGRMDRLARMIESRWGVAKRKANFLATQETGMLTAKFRMERAKNAGSVRYVWHTRRDSRVRHDHAELDGKTFFWDQPPLVDAARGRHANPGEDFGCRCFAEPLIEVFQKEAAA